MENIRTAWLASKWYRVALVAALVWFVLRLAVQVIYASGMMPELTGEDGLPMDLPVYLGAAQKFILGQDLYPQDLSDSTFHYPYSPPFAMLSTVLLLLPERGIAIAGTLLSVVVYGLLYLKWMQIFQRLSLPAVAEKMAYVLPVWLIFSAFWGLVVFLNIGILVALIATFLIDNILKERLGWSAALAVSLMISKIMWLFPLALPLLFGRRKFFVKLAGLTVLLYLLLVGISMLIGGPAYILAQYPQYFIHLQRIASEFPWHVRDAVPFLGYNHSIKQALVFVLGDSSWVLNLATIVKVLILAPLAFLFWKLFRADAMPDSAMFKIGLVFSLYLGAFVWLDIVWEVLLGVAIFPFALVLLTKTWQKGALWGLFLLYAFVDIIQFFSYIFGGDDIVVMGGAYVLTDPALHLPLSMMVILAFYAIILRNLWQWLPNLANSGQRKTG
jgi:hypothetical protein